VSQPTESAQGVQASPKRVPAESLAKILRKQSVLICCGSGGVGKTTTSAALALQAALMGRKAVVCTIDPARRLANSLGITELGNEVVQVDPERFAQAGLGQPEGSLHALMLDSKRTFDRLIERYAKDPERRKRILENRFYQQMSGTVVGSSDYMAMEKLYELHETGEFDLIVLDTPPTKHALDFLQAPQRMRNAFDESSLEIFLKPWADAGKRSLGFLGRALGRLVKKVDAILGLKFVEDLADFFQAFEGMYEGFRSRAGRVDNLLREEFTSFVVVTSPAPLPMEEAGYFCERLRELEMPLDGLIVNRVQPSSLDERAARDDLRRRLDQQGPRGMIEAAMAAAGQQPGDADTGEARLLHPLLRAFTDQELLASGDQSRIEAFLAGPAHGLVAHEVPRFSTDVYDMSGLKAMIDRLFPAQAAAGAEPTGGAEA
jgi:anion-transporting  ArsA/GET3 family ATPase